MAEPRLSDPAPPSSPPSPAPQRSRAPIAGAVAAALVLATPLVMRWEGKRNDPYLDIVKVPTVCYGETRVAMRRYSDGECRDMLGKALEARYMRLVLACTPVLVDRPYQLAAATSLAYNIGTAAYCRSTVARRFNSGLFLSGCEAFLMWNRAGGRVIAGLDRRRRDERKLCMTGLV